MKKVKLTRMQYEDVRKLLNFGRSSLGNVPEYNVADMIQNVRKALHMTQTQLAKNVGVSQSLIARLEAGKVSPTWSTLTKVFKALSCDILCLPIMKEPLDEIVRIQAEKYLKIAEKYTKGTLLLEKQSVSQSSMNELIKDEVDRLLREGSSEIWD